MVLMRMDDCIAFVIGHEVCLLDVDDMEVQDNCTATGLWFIFLTIRRHDATTALWFIFLAQTKTIEQNSYFYFAWIWRILKL